MHLGDNIKKIRKVCRLTQKAFAESMGVTEAMQKTYELDKSKPDLIYMDKLAGMTGISPTLLFKEPINVEKIREKVTKVTKESRQDYSTDYLTGKLETKDEVLAEKERVLKEIEARRQDAEKKANEYFELNKELIGIIKEKLTDILANSAESIDQLTTITHLIRADDSVVMDNQDQDAGREVGVSATKASKLENDAVRIDAELGKMKDADKPHKRGKRTP